MRERVVSINRVAEVVKGGGNFRFAALVVVGDRNGHVGVGIGKAQGVLEAIRKTGQGAKKHIFTVPIVNTTIPHQVTGISRAGRVLLKPTGEGIGVIASSLVRAVYELTGIKDIRPKSLGTPDPQNIVNATVEGLKSLKAAEQVAKLGGKSIERILG